MAGYHSVVGIAKTLKHNLDIYCHSTGVSEQSFVTNAVSKALLEHGVDDKAVQIMKVLTDMDSNIDLLREIQRRYTAMDFFDGFNESNRNKKIEDLRRKGADEDYIEMSTSVYDGTKTKITENREKLRQLADLLNPKPKQYGHPIEEWRAMRGKKEAETIEEPKQLGRKPRFKREPTLEEIAEMNRRNKHPFGDKNKW